MAMLRLARATDRADLVRLVVSVRTPDDLYYADELPGPEVTVVYTRAAPPGEHPPGRAGSRPPTSPRCSAAEAPRPTSAARPASPTPPAACWSTSACPVERIRVERFGPTG